MGIEYRQDHRPNNRDHPCPTKTTAKTATTTSTTSTS